MERFDRMYKKKLIFLEDVWIFSYYLHFCRNAIKSEIYQLIVTETREISKHITN